MSATKTIEDLIILGRACPEPLRDGRVTVCLGGYSPTIGFVRIYPTRTDMEWHNWDIVSVEVEKNDQDTREESWKIAGSRSEWEHLSDKAKVVGSLPKYDRLSLVANLADDCVQDINDIHRSLGIVKPRIHKRYFANNRSYGELFQNALPGLGDPTKVKRDFPFEPRLTYTCSTCRAKSHHDQQVLEWGFYEWIRKNPSNMDQVWVNALLDSPDHIIYLFVGNQARHRTSFMVISLLRVPTGPVQSPLMPYPRWIKD